MTLTIQGTAIYHCRNYGLKDYASNNPPGTSLPTQLHYRGSANAAGPGIEEQSFLRCYRVPVTQRQQDHNKLINICTFAYFAAYNPYWQHQLG